MADTIMVAVDGEPEHRAALDWAAARAAWMPARLELIHVVERSFADSGEQSGRMLTLAGRALVAEEERYALRRARAALHLEHADADPPRAEPEIRSRVVVGHAGRDVVTASAGAVLLVVGTPPAARTQRALAGSIAARVASAAACTVVAVPHGWRGHGHGVVVGVDGEPPTGPAVDFAADEAARLGEPLVVVYAGYAVGAVRDGRQPAGPATVGDVRERIVEDAVDRARRRHLRLVVRTRVVEAAPSAGLVSEAHGARMLVLGTHDRRGVKRVVLGSVGHDVLLRARLPVVIARAATVSVSPSSDPAPA
ncbi:universal stress protein [Leifsonia virtsii]|uniref:Universal stress protein n=1 Tax=Leifsonia virtsii TaxID=3035915 RepID=A0ABT8IWS0_9MICO|nr:universal stress protein [Leifsonia virtsii]MDN4597278.1 universal stress protein [Leifsonia virtsii]